MWASITVCILRRDKKHREHRSHAVYKNSHDISPSLRANAAEYFAKQRHGAHNLRCSAEIRKVSQFQKKKTEFNFKPSSAEAEQSMYIGAAEHCQLSIHFNRCVSMHLYWPIRLPLRPTRELTLQQA